MEAKDFKEQIRMSPELLAEYILVSHNNKDVKLTSLCKIEDIRRDIKMLKNKKHRLNKCCVLSHHKANLLLTRALRNSRKEIKLTNLKRRNKDGNNASY